MNVVFRVDASMQIGSGHVMRCLTLADELALRGAGATFICRELQGNLIDFIAAKGYRVRGLPRPAVEYAPTVEDVAHVAWLGVSQEEDAAATATALGSLPKPQWLIVDHYALGSRWERVLTPCAGKIMVIDDLADRSHDCELLLDQNFYLDPLVRYDGLVPGTCRKLLGPRYALLRPEFATAGKNLRRRDGKIGRILVFFGGVDPSNETWKTLLALEATGAQDVVVDVVVGAGNQQKERIEEFCRDHERYHYHCQVDNMAELMVAADLAIGAGGTTTWERCSVALPSVSIVIAANQLETTQAVAWAGATVYLGTHDEVSVEEISSAVMDLKNAPERVVALGRKSLSIVRSDEPADRLDVADVIMGDDHAES